MCPKPSSIATRFLKELEESGGVVTWNQNKDNGASLKESMIFHNFLENDKLANCECFDLGYKVMVCHGMLECAERYEQTADNIIVCLICLEIILVLLIISRLKITRIYSPIEEDLRMCLNKVITPKRLEEFSVNKDISSLTLYLGLHVHVYVTLYELLWMMEHLVKGLILQLFMLTTLTSRLTEKYPILQSIGMGKGISDMSL